VNAVTPASLRLPECAREQAARDGPARCDAASAASISGARLPVPRASGDGRASAWGTGCPGVMSFHQWSNTAGARLGGKRGA
jgi:hypothetical protein